MRHSIYAAAAFVAATYKLDLTVQEHLNTIEVAFAKGDISWSKRIIKEAVERTKEVSDTPNGAVDFLIVHLTECIMEVGLCE